MNKRNGGADFSNREPLKALTHFESPPITSSTGGQDVRFKLLSALTVSRQNGSKTPTRFERASLEHHSVHHWTLQQPIFSAISRLFPFQMNKTIALWFYVRVFNGKMVSDEVSYNYWLKQLPRKPTKFQREPTFSGSFD